MRVFLDANILFSAALPHSRTRALLNVLMDRTDSDCLTNDYAIDEARRNIVAKFPDAEKALDRLAKKCLRVLPMVRNFEAGLPLKDVPILGGAIAGHATHLLTGDERDFGKLWGQSIQGVKIVSPQMLAAEMWLV